MSGIGRSQLTRERVLEAIVQIDAAGDFFETLHRRKDGTTFPVEISSNGSIWASDKQVFCICRDITERRHAEQQIENRGISSRPCSTPFRRGCSGKTWISGILAAILLCP